MMEIAYAGYPAAAMQMHCLRVGAAARVVGEFNLAHFGAALAMRLIRVLRL
jgi:hypothetical protein